MTFDRRRFLRTAAAGSIAGLAGCGALGGNSVATTPHETFSGADAAPETPRLSTDGKWVTDPDGNHVVLRGVNTVDPWWARQNDDLRGQSYRDTLRFALDREQAWYPRVIRVPAQPRSIDRQQLDIYVERFLDPVVKHCKRQGVYVIIDYHTIEPYDTNDVDERVRAFWKTVAPRYADEKHVLYELFNEPTRPFGDGMESWKHWRETAQPWVDLIREKAEKNPIIVGSPRWSSLTKYAATAPFDGDNLIYSAHIYPSTPQEDWEPNFGKPAESVPVMVTEWGYIDVDGPGHDPHMRGTTSGWAEPFREWLEGHENVGWAAWCFDSVWDPQMFTTSWDLLGGEQFMGRFTKRWLYETRNDTVPSSMQFQSGAAPSGQPSDSSPPSAPDTLSVSKAGTFNATLSWYLATDSETSVAKYVVYVDGERATVVGDKSTDATVVGLDAETEYEFYVTAVDVAGNESKPSNTVTATTGELTVDAEIAKTDSAPTIDGRGDDSAWSDVLAQSMENVIVGSTDGSSDLGGQWRAVWDEQALYVLVELSDESLTNDSTADYKDDALEIYVDADNSKLPDYDGTNDFQYVIPYGKKGVTTGANSAPRTRGVQQVQRETGDGWTVEFAAPWTTLGTKPGPETPIGFEIQVNDDDDGSGRDAKLAWYGTGDSAWDTPSSFATVMLVE